MDKDNFYKVCKVSDLKESIGERYLVNDTDIALFKINGKIFAVNNVCPHKQANIMHEGFVENECVVCPLHGWTFELSTGNLIGGSRGLKSYPVEIKNEDIYVQVIPKELNW